MIARLSEPRFPLFYSFVCSAIFVHLRGYVRHRFTRQQTNYSTTLAPLNALMYALSAVPNRPRLEVAVMYRIRLLGKSLKAKSSIAYFALKYLLIGGLFHWIFLA